MPKRVESIQQPSELIEFQKIRDHRIALCQRAEELSSELKVINAALAKVGVSGETKFNQKPIQRPAPKPLSAKARELVGNIVKFGEPEAPPPAKPDKTADLIAQSKALSAELAATREAIEAIRPAEFDSMLKASEVFCARHADEYRTVAENLANAAAMLADAVIEHDRFTRDMTAAGLTWSFLKPIPLTLVGDDVLFRLSELVRAASRNGHANIDAATLRRWTQHQRHLVEAPTRHSRPEVSKVRAGVVGAFSKDATLVRSGAKPLPLAASVRNPRVIASAMRRK